MIGKSRTHPRNQLQREDAPQTTPSKARRMMQIQEEVEVLPPIYAAPTTETLDDGSVFQHHPYTIQAPSHTRAPFGSQQTASFASFSRNTYQVPSTPSRTHISSSSSSIRTMRKKVPSSTKKARRRKIKRRPNVPRDFQIPGDLMAVRVQAVNVAQRSAFDLNPAVSLEEWESIAEHGPRNVYKRLSPSYQHLQIIHRLQSMSVVRQPQFSPSVHRNCDPFVEWDQEPHRKNQRDGRYRSIDPVQATRNILPNSAPVLSNKKPRLPMRSDVGFPNATEEEIRLKQLEISYETDWEEASPRLVVLVTSDDLGTAVLEETDLDKCSEEHIAWNGGGLEGLPFAGKQLIEAKERNLRYFGKGTLGLNEYIKQDRTSMLAPPLDASYSASQGWRPRPYHDRPAGLQYILASPIEVQLDVQGPLTCSLTLYSLPAPEQRNGQPYGKMSEHFWFPQGDWDGLVKLKLAQTKEGGMDEELLASWFRKKHKAIFSYDPLSVPGNLDSLFVVIEVFKTASLSDSSIAPRRTSRKWAADPIFQEFGLELQTPFCFGVAKVSGTSDLSWPQGDVRDVPMYVYPPLFESQEAFVARLMTILHGPSEMVSQSDSDSRHGEDDDIPTLEEISKKRLTVSRLFRSPKPSKHRSTSSANAGTANNTKSETDGRSQIFVSSIPTDFLQAMLAKLDIPKSLESSHVGRTIPTFLSDVSGDFAVLLDKNIGSIQSLAPVENPRKRSDLMRLPKSLEPAGYLGYSEFREVLPLPCRKEKHYDVDRTYPLRSLINLLYLYPRRLRPTGSSSPQMESANYIIRFRILRIGSKGNDGPSERHAGTALALFYNVCPWTGSEMVDTVYTNLSFTNNDPDPDGYYRMKDEFKIRLPVVIDGTYALEVSLFQVHVADGETLSLNLRADATIPLSSSSYRESTSSSRVTTVIPNGNHRLKLGNLQLQLETRLVSSTHVGDTSVAAMLRDFPGNIPEDSHQSSRTDMMRQVTWSSSSGIHSTDNADAFASVLFNASDSTITSHFETLLHLVTGNFLRPAKDSHTDGADLHSVSVVKSLICLFEMLRKIKYHFSSSFPPLRDELEIRMFIKKIIDAFDEGYLHSSKSLLDNLNSSFVDSVQFNTSVSMDDTKENDREPVHKDEAIRLKNKRSHLGYSGIRVSRIIATLGASTTPFSRIAYGATKMDRLRVEAELRYSDPNTSLYFEDDETVLTSPSVIERRISGFWRESTTKENNAVKELNVDLSDGNSIVRTSSSASNRPSETQQQTSTGGTEFATRVRTAAQVMLAPCVGPSFSNIIITGRPRSSNQQEHENPTKSPEVLDVADEDDTSCLFHEGSDLDDEDSKRDGDENEANYRGATGAPQLVLSATMDGVSLGQVTGDYLYESIMILWLKTWRRDMDLPFEKDIEVAPSSSNFNYSVLIPSDYVNIFKTPGRNSFQGFFDNIDFLLPLCLKSITLRIGVEVLPHHGLTTRVILDENHMMIFEPFIVMLARSLMEQAMAATRTAVERETSLLKALKSSHLALEFLIGMMSFLHLEQMRVMLQTLFSTLRECEVEQLGIQSVEEDFVWDEETLHRVRSSRLLRLSAIEELAALAPFVALNYPLRYSANTKAIPRNRSSWMHQFKEYADFSDLFQPLFPNDEFHRAPYSGWLANMVIREGLSICALSCEAVVAEAMAHIEVTNPDTSKSKGTQSSLTRRPGAQLKRGDLLMFQSLAIHGITCIYELVLRRHAMDRRYQGDSARERIAALFAAPILEKSITSVRWLARMEATHKVRSMWLLSFVYILQESPEFLIRAHIRAFCDPQDDIRIHRFIRLLRLCSSTFQGFVDSARHAPAPTEVDKLFSPWLLQESFNTICAATNAVVEETVDLTSSYPDEQRKILQGIMDLLLHMLTTPQSSVTHLRAIGSALQALERFGVELFLEMAANNFQHWVRVMLSLMNSVSLSVRAIAVDFVVCLIGSVFDVFGNIAELTVVFATVLPEVVAREIALYSVSGCILQAEDLSKSIWPLRRSIADLEDANPVDDERVDPQLSPILSHFCRACQAIIDGVVIEICSKGNTISIVGSRIDCEDHRNRCFDADEESLFEAATFFLPETSPMQRIRWLLTLRSTQQKKSRWIEEAEALFMCAKTIIDSIPHLAHLWRPSHFPLWSDGKRSLWLETVGEDLGHPDRGNAQVMDFTEQFLEPPDILGSVWKVASNGRLQQPKVVTMCSMLGVAVMEMVDAYSKEDIFGSLCYSRLEILQKELSSVLDTRCQRDTGGAHFLRLGAKKTQAEEEAALRKAIGLISASATRLAETLVANVEELTDAYDSSGRHFNTEKRELQCQFVGLQISGHKPSRFRESTTIPTFLEWETPTVLRVPSSMVQRARMGKDLFSAQICLDIAEPLRDYLERQLGASFVIVQTTPPTFSWKEGLTYLNVFPLDSSIVSPSGFFGGPKFTRRFFYRIHGATPNDKAVVELTVAHAFPCSLSRQRSVVTTEIRIST